MATKHADTLSTADSLNTLIPIGLAAAVVALWAAFLYAPTERIEGDVQRILYMHVPAAMTMYVAYGLVFLSSVLYLVRRDSRWDELGAAAAEVGTVFATTVLVTGPIWAKKVWGTYWVWDARLTSMLLLWLIFCAYLMLRAYGGEREQVARYCAVIGIIGFADLPIIHYSVQWWRTLHPEPKVMTQGSVGGGMEPSMLLALALGTLAALMLFAVLLRLRLRLERAERRVEVAGQLLRSEA